MLTFFNDLLLKVGDTLLSWLLALPLDAVLIIVSVGTGAILVLVRLFTTNQDLLRRCSQDKKRLGELMREAKQRKDKPAVQRHRMTRNMIGLKTMRSEGLPLLAAVLPILIIATWCFQRLELVPPKAEEPVQLIAYFPISAAGQVVHVVPQEGLASEDGWVREIKAVTDPSEGPPHGMATWHLQAKGQPEPYLVEIRYKKGTYTKELLVGQRTYSTPAEFYGPDDPITCAEIKLPQAKLFGVVPGFDWLRLPPWMVAYFLIAIPSVSLFKRVTHIY
jgi:uncharacterized membrane protein (DUF106 family)